MHGLHLTHSDQGRYMYLSSIRCEKSGHSLIVCSPLLAVFGSHASHNTLSGPVHFQERNTPEEAIAGPLLHQQLGNSMAERQGNYHALNIVYSQHIIFLFIINVFLKWKAKLLNEKLHFYPYKRFF